jgi:hypothetical protein
MFAKDCGWVDYKSLRDSYSSHSYVLHAYVVRERWS